MWVQFVSLLYYWPKGGERDVGLQKPPQIKIGPQPHPIVSNLRNGLIRLLGDGQCGDRRLLEHAGLVLWRSWASIRDGFIVPATTGQSNQFPTAIFRNHQPRRGELIDLEILRAIVELYVIGMFNVTYLSYWFLLE